CFEALGRDRRAKELYTLYLQAFGIQAERMGPSGVPLLHRFARECLRLGLLKQEALAAARKATRAYPGNLSFKVTLARAYLENGRAEGAVQILRGVLQQRGDDFETQFLLGRAYATLDEREKALEAFRAALQHQPGNRQVEEAIAKLTSKIQ
ncbi:MAG: tetratricopeptide repeat protein, partial [Acidobacteriota bacterium]